jgi:AcrR family transcriptional regulator
MQDRRVTIQELAEEVGISTGSVNSILTDDLATRRVSTKFVPKLLMMEQKQLLLEVAQDILVSTNSNPESAKLLTKYDAIPLLKSFRHFRRK